MLIGILGIALGWALGWLAWKSRLPRPVIDVVLSAALLTGIVIMSYADGGIARGGAGVAAGIALASLATIAVRLLGGSARREPHSR